MQLKFKPCLKCFTLTIKGWDYASCVPKIPILRYKAACQKTEKGSAKIQYYHITFETPSPHIHTSREIKKKYLKRKGPRLIYLISLSLILEMKYNLTRSMITLVIPPFKHRVLYRIEFTFYVFFFMINDISFLFVCLCLFLPIIHKVCPHMNEQCGHFLVGIIVSKIWVTGHGESWEVEDFRSVGDSWKRK